MTKPYAIARVKADTLADKLIIIMFFFWLWTVLPNATVSVTNIHEWNEAQISSRTQLDDPRWDWNSWCSKHMLGDILFSTQLLVTHFVTIFSFCDNHDILGIYLACATLSGQKEWENMLILLLGTTFKHRISLMTIVIITDRKFRDQVTEVLHKMSPSMWWSQQLFESHLWSSQ